MKKYEIFLYIFTLLVGVPIIIYVIVQLLLLPKTTVYQPEYDHKVKIQNVEATMIFNYNEDTIKCIWIEDKLFLPATKEDYENL